MANRFQLMLLGAFAFHLPVTAQAGAVPLFPNPEVILDQADEEYESFFSANDWKLKSVDIAGETRAVRYQSSMMLTPPSLQRTGIYSWAVLYRLKDRYRSAGAALYVCRTAAVSLKHRIVDFDWKWLKSVKLELIVDPSDAPCGGKGTPGSQWSPVPDSIRNIVR